MNADSLGFSGCASHNSAIGVGCGQVYFPAAELATECGIARREVELSILDGTVANRIALDIPGQSLSSYLEAEA
jgi:hypothetical protein